MMVIVDIAIFILNCYAQVYFYLNVVPFRAYLLDDVPGKMIVVCTTLIVFIFFMWMKVMAYLKLVNRFGTMIKIIEVTVQELATFLALFSITLIAFATIFHNILVDCTDWGVNVHGEHTLTASFYNLFFSIRTLLNFTY